jgi:CubicO group peptidase (beta-lactamase class C family)
LRVNWRRYFFLFIFLLSQKVLPAQSIPSLIDSAVHYCNRHFSFEGAVLVADNNKTIYSAATGEANKEWKIKNSLDTRFRIASISKQFAGYILFTLVQEGKIHWEDKVCEYLPQFCSKEKTEVTLSNLMHHTSGLHELTALKNFDEKEFYPKDSLIQMIANTSLDFAPGSQYAYSNSNFYIAGIIAERVCHTSYDSILMQRVLVSAHLVNTGLDHEGLVLQKRATAYMQSNNKTQVADYLNMETPFSAGGMYSTANDLLKWSRFFQKKIASSSSLRSLLQISMVQNDTNLYSAGWCILPNEILHTGHINGFANLISIDTAHQRTIIILSNSDFKKLYVLQETIVSLLNNNKNALQWTTTKLSNRQMDEMTGSFQYKNSVVTINNENGKLMNRVRGRSMELFPYAKDVFFTKDYDGDIILERNEKNEIIAIRVFQNYSFVRFKKIK